MSEHLAVRHQEAGDTTPIQGRVFARDCKGRASRSRTGALLGARKASQQDEQLRQAAEWFDLTTSRSIAYRL
jgi:hypothetical protein